MNKEQFLKKVKIDKTTIESDNVLNYKIIHFSLKGYPFSAMYIEQKNQWQKIGISHGDFEEKAPNLYNRCPACNNLFESDIECKALRIEWIEEIIKKNRENG